MEKSIRKYMWFSLIVFLFLPFIGCLQCQAATKGMDVKSTVTSKTKIQLSWKKKSVSGYDIYRAPYSEDGEIGTYKRIATISGKKTSYTDKVSYKKYYIYKIKGYTGTGSKKTYKFEGECTAYAGVFQACWQEDLHSDAKVTPNSIQLEMSAPEGMVPNGFEIYRSVGSLAYRKIANVNSKHSYAEYIDNDVIPGTTYSYKVRAYKKNGKKTIYGKDSIPIQLSAVNQIGKYSVVSLTEDNKTVSAITLALTSDADNANTIFSDNISGVQTEYFYKAAGKDVWISLYLVQYSYDNKTWHKFTDREIILKPGATLYIMLQEESGNPFYYSSSNGKNSLIRYLGVGYNNLYALMSIDLIKGSAEAERDGEMYH